MKQQHASGSECQRRLHQWPQWEINELSIAGLATLISLTEVSTGSGCPRRPLGLEVRRCALVCVRVFHRTPIHLADTCQNLGWPTPIQRFLISESIMWATSVKGCQIPVLIGWPRYAHRHARAHARKNTHTLPFNRDSSNLWRSRLFKKKKKGGGVRAAVRHSKKTHQF